MLAFITTIVFAKLNLVIALCAMLIERYVGYPKLLLRFFNHPVVWIGAVLGWLEARLNKRTRISGIVTLFLIILVVLCVTVPITIFLRTSDGFWVIEAALASTLLAQKELYLHVKAVADGLANNLTAGRDAVAKIVGRDPHTLDGSGVSKAAIESLAENTSDGIIAPLFWLLVAGLPGIAIYKAVNTCDSMIGYKTERYQEFGWASARLDDVLNLVPARITGIMFALAGGANIKTVLAIMRRDAPNHVSPNAGWPESALAASLGITLGGPRSYRGKAVELAWMGEGRKDLGADDICAALEIFRSVLTMAACFCASLFAVSLMV